MSETVHYRGFLRPTGLTVSEFLGEGESMDDYYREAFEIEGKVYTVDNREYDSDDDIFESKDGSDGMIEYRLRYYNGGCSFDEAIESALKNRS